MHPRNILFVYCALSSLLLQSAIARAEEKPGVEATITVRVPADAELFFDGMPTKSKGVERVFATPPLDAARTFHYNVLARWQEQGKTVERSRARRDSSWSEDRTLLYRLRVFEIRSAPGGSVRFGGRRAPASRSRGQALAAGPRQRCAAERRYDSRHRPGCRPDLQERRRSPRIPRRFQRQLSLPGPGDGGCAPSGRRRRSRRDAGPRPNRPGQHQGQRSGSCSAPRSGQGWRVHPPRARGPCRGRDLRSLAARRTVHQGPQARRRPGPCDRGSGRQGRDRAEG